MTGFSPIAAGTEGLRVIRREPKALMGWIAIWTLALLVVATLQVLTMATGSISGAAQAGILGLVRRFGPLWPLLVLTLLVLWVMTTATLFRAVLRRDEHGWHLFKLGGDELRLGVITAAGLVMVTVLGSGPALLLWLLAKPVLAAIPEFGRWVVLAGILGTVVIEVWILVRLCLAPVHTFAEGRFHVFGYWKLTAHHFWQIALSHLLVVLEVFVFWLISGIFALAFTALMPDLSHQKFGFGDQALLWARIVGAAAFTALIIVVPATLICACQAYAYRAITESEKGFWS